MCARFERANAPNVGEAPADEPTTGSIGSHSIHLPDDTGVGPHHLRGMNIHRHAAPCGGPDVEEAPCEVDRVAEGGNAKHLVAWTE